MKRRLYLYVLAVALIIILGAGMSAVAAKQPFKWSVLPKINHNKTEGWQLGIEAKLNNLFGQDEFSLGGDYAFATKTPYGFYTYKFDLKSNQFYSSGYKDFLTKGIYNNSILYQEEKFLNLGVTHVARSGENFYLTDLCVEYTDRASVDPAFDSGKDLTIVPGIFGMYKGAIAKVNLTYGMDTKYSDYNYLKSQVLVKKNFDLTQKDRIVIGGELGAMRGNYPDLQQFYLGSSEFNFFPNFKTKALSSLGKVASADVLEPNIYLDGYEDNAFSGENMYTGKIEYQHRLFANAWKDLPAIPYGKVYFLAGNAWTGDLASGFTQPKMAVGLGVNVEHALIQAETNHEWYLGFNIAKGFGEKSAVTVGFEAGMNFNLINQLFSNLNPIQGE